MFPGKKMQQIQNFKLEIEVHPFLNFSSTADNPYKASFADMDGHMYGIEIINKVTSDRMNLHKLMQDGLGFDPYRCFEGQL